MDHHRFDQIARAVVSRRAGLGAGLAALCGGVALDAEAKKHKKKKKPKTCKPACAACQACDKGTCKPVANGTGCGSGNTCQGGVCKPSTPAGCTQDNQICNGDGRCLGTVCKPKPTCAPVGAQHIADESFQCCSGNMTCEDTPPFGILCTCVQHPYDGTAGNVCLSDEDCAGGECVGYTCRWCSGDDCPPVYEFRRSFGSYGTGSGQFQEPGALAMTPGGNLLVADGTGYRVLEFTTSGSLVRTIGTGTYGFGNNQFVYPVAVAVDADGNIYVGEATRVQKFSRTGVYLRTFGVSGVNGADNQHLTAVSGLAFDSHALLYISDSGYESNPYGRVQVFRTDGTYVRTITRSGETFFGTIAINAHDHLFVRSDNRGALLEFDPNGAFVASRPLTDEPNRGYSGNFAFGPDGSCFACRDTSVNNARTMVVQYSPTWEKVREFFTTSEPSPPTDHQMIANGVAVDTAGNLYIADMGFIDAPPPSRANPRIVVYNHLTTGGHSRDARSGKRSQHQKKRMGNRKR